MMYIIILKFSNVSKTYILQHSYQFLYWIVENKQEKTIILSKPIPSICYALLYDYFYKH